MGTPEIQEQRASGQEALLEILHRYKPPWRIEEADRYLDELQAQEEVLGRVGLAREQEKKARAMLEAARFEILWQRGELEVARGYFEGLQKEIRNAIAGFRKEIRREGGLKKAGYVVDGKLVDEETARRQAAIRVLGQRSGQLVETIKEIEGKREAGEELTPEDLGREHAARVLDDYLHSMMFFRATGSAAYLKRIIWDLERRKDDPRGLDSTQAEKVLKAVRRDIPESAQLKTLGEYAVRVDGREVPVVAVEAEKRENISYLGARIAEVVTETVEEVTGKKPTPAELTTGGGLDLEEAARRRIKEITWKCAREWVRAAILREPKGKYSLPRGMASLKREMENWGVSPDCLRKIFAERGYRNWFDIVELLDESYNRAIGAGGVVADPKIEPGKIPAPIGLAVGEVCTLFETIGPGNFSRANPPDLDRVVSPIGDLGFRKELARKARIILGVVESGGGLDEAMNAGGFRPYPQYETAVLHDGLCFESPPIDLEEVREARGWQLPDGPWRSRHIPDVFKHLAATKQMGFEPSKAIKLAVLWERLTLAGVDLEEYVRIKTMDLRQAIDVCAQRDIRLPRGKTPQEILAESLVEKACQLKGFGDEIKEELQMALATLDPYLASDGELDLSKVGSLIESRPWGQKIDWKIIGQLEPDLGLHLGKRARDILQALCFEKAYEEYLRNMVNFRVGREEKDLPGHIDEIVENARFLRYRLLRQLGWDPAKPWSENIAQLLEKTQWAEYGKDIRQYLRGGMLVDYDPEMRRWLLLRVGVDIAQPLPKRGYKAWAENLESLIAAAQRRQKGKKPTKGLLSDIDKAEIKGILRALQELKEKDPVLRFKKELAEAAFKKYLEKGKIMLAKRGDLTVEELFEALHIELNGILSLDEAAPVFVGDWDGDKLAAILEKEFSRSFLARFIKDPMGTLEGVMLKIFDLIHGRSEAEAQKLGVLRYIVPDPGPNLTVFLFNTGVFSLATVLSTGVRSLPEFLITFVGNQPVFHAYPFIDRFLPILEEISPIPIGLNLQFFLLMIPQVLFPAPLSGMKLQGWVLRKTLEWIHGILVRHRWGRLFSKAEMERVRKTQVPGAKR